MRPPIAASTLLLLLIAIVDGKAQAQPGSGSDAGSGYVSPPEPEPKPPSQVAGALQPAPIMDGVVAAKTRAALLAEAEYNAYRFEHARAAYASQTVQTWIIFVVVLAVFAFGLVLSYQYSQDGLRRALALGFKKEELSEAESALATLRTQTPLDATQIKRLESRIGRLKARVAKLDVERQLEELNARLESAKTKGDQKKQAVLERKLEAAEEGKTHQLGLGPAGINVSTQALGVVVLALSLGFFYLYLRYVYPINNNALVEPPEHEEHKAE